MSIWDEDGYFYVVDRKRDMIVRDGENMFTAPVEEAVQKHPAVREYTRCDRRSSWRMRETVKAVVVLKKE